MKLSSAQTPNDVRSADAELQKEAGVFPMNNASDLRREENLPNNIHYAAKIVKSVLSHCAVISIIVWDVEPEGIYRAPLEKRMHLTNLC